MVKPSDLLVVAAQSKERHKNELEHIGISEKRQKTFELSLTIAERLVPFLLKKY